MTESQTSGFAKWVSSSSNAANTLELLHLEYEDYGLHFVTPDQYDWTHS